LRRREALIRRHDMTTKRSITPYEAVAFLRDADHVYCANLSNTFPDFDAEDSQYVTKQVPKAEHREKRVVLVTDEGHSFSKTAKNSHLNHSNRTKNWYVLNVHGNGSLTLTDFPPTASAQSDSLTATEMLAAVGADADADANSRPSPEDIETFHAGATALREEINATLSEFNEPGDEKRVRKSIAQWNERVAKFIDMFDDLVAMGESIYAKASAGMRSHITTQLKRLSAMVEDLQKRSSVLSDKHFRLGQTLDRSDKRIDESSRMMDAMMEEWNEAFKLLGLEE